MMARQFPRYRFLLQSRFDTSAWFVGLWTATLLRHEFDLSQMNNWGVARMAVLAALLQVGLGVLAGLYVHRWRYGTFEEVAASARVVAGVTVAITLVPAKTRSPRFTATSTRAAGR